MHNKRIYQVCLTPFRLGIYSKIDLVGVDDIAWCRGIYPHFSPPDPALIASSKQLGMLRNDTDLHFHESMFIPTLALQIRP
jgi:hypothetical protein